jgi:hypothetical protein
MALNHSAKGSVPQTRLRVWDSFNISGRFAGISVPQSRNRQAKLNPSQKLRNGGPQCRATEQGWCDPAFSEIDIVLGKGAARAA